MRALKTIRHRLRSLLHGSQVEQELDEELRDHLERQIEMHVRAGLSPAAARAAALREFGNVASIQEQVRDVRRVGWIEDLVRDVLYGFRSMRRAPGSMAVAALSLACAVGANTAIFSVVNALMLRGLPVGAPEELVELFMPRTTGPPGNFSHPLYERVRAENTVFRDLVAVSSPTIRVELGEDRTASGKLVSGNFFAALGIQPSLGRLLTPDDDRRDAPGSVAVIGYGLWQREFGGAPGAIGRTLRVGRAALVIVGVLPAAFTGLTVGRADDIYAPLASDAVISPKTLLDAPSAGWLKVVGRLRPGVSGEQARAEANVIYARYVEDMAPFASEAETRRRRADRLELASARAGLSGPRLEFARPVLLLMGAVAFVLLIACANVVNLLLTRAVARRREIAVRLSIGASRGRLVRQLLTESAVLGVLGGAAGLALGAWGTRHIATWMANGDPAVAYDIALDARVLGFTLAISFASALVAGLAPALRVSRTRAAVLYEDARTPMPGRTMSRWSRALIASQSALSVLLLAGALLLLTTLHNFRTRDFGFDRENVFTMRLEPGRTGFTGDRRVAYFREVLDRTRNTPGVRAAAVALGMPVISAGIDSSFAIEGQPAEPDANVFVNAVTEGYFATTGTRLLAGRDFGAQDGPASPPVAIANDAVARRYFGGRSPLGQRVRVGIRGVVEIVGVVETTAYASLRETDSPIVYVHALQWGQGGGFNLIVKSAETPGALAAALRQDLRRVAAVPVTQPALLSDDIDRTLVRERLIARVLTLFAALALGLAAVGIYAVMVYAVSQRTSEIGVRLALGATRASVMRPVLAESARLVAVGAAIGVPAAAALTGLLSSVLYGVTPTDAGVFSTVVLLLFAVALVAAAVPAWRASRVDPLVALRDG
jgi:predicted permease